MRAKQTAEALPTECRAEAGSVELPMPLELNACHMGEWSGYNKKHAKPSAATHKQYGQGVCLEKLAICKSFIFKVRHCLILKQEKQLLDLSVGWLFVLEACRAITQYIQEKEKADQ